VCSVHAPDVFPYVVLYQAVVVVQVEVVMGRIILSHSLHCHAPTPLVKPVSKPQHSCVHHSAVQWLCNQFARMATDDAAPTALLVDKHAEYIRCLDRVRRPARDTRAETLRAAGPWY
jgi:hypothetical protein